MDKITDIRTYMMGVAILCIMVFHSSDIFIVPSFMEFIQKTGYLGVDIFFFVSAYGLFYSMKKHLPAKQWYMRRFERILPAYWIVTLFTGLMVHWSLYEHIREEVFFGFIPDGTNPIVFYDVLFWYVPVALLFYLFFPLLYRYRRQIAFGFVPIAVAAYVLSHMISIYFINKEWSFYLPRIVSRIPIFLIGMIYADYEDAVRQRMNLYSTMLLVCVSFAAFLLLELHAMDITTFMSFPADTYVLMMCSMPFVIFVCSLLRQYLKVLNPFVLYCGRYSLELYLLHVSFTWIVPRSELFDGINTNYTFLGAFLLSFPCAFLLNKGVALLLRKNG